MTKLMAWAALAGAVIGLVLLSAEGIAMNTDDGSVVVYEGAYEPLPGIAMSTGAAEASEELDRALAEELDRASDAQKWWNQLPLPWWAYPLIGAGSAAVLSAPFAIAGVRLDRSRR